VIEIGSGTDYFNILLSMYSCVLSYKGITANRGFVIVPLDVQSSLLSCVVVSFSAWMKYKLFPFLSDKSPLEFKRAEFTNVPSW
jgi:hypothetical protein